MTRGHFSTAVILFVTILTVSQVYGDWQRANSLWGKRSMAYAVEPLIAYDISLKRGDSLGGTNNFGRLNSMWGRKKRGTQWQRANGLWGKRSADFSVESKYNTDEQ